jgi:phosphoribosylamine-glycine ligase
MLGSGRVVTSGGLVMAVSATADTLKRAIKLAYAGVSRVKFHGKFYGRDIAYKSVLPSTRRRKC